MATVSVAGYISSATTVNSTTKAFSLPSGIVNGSNAWVLVSWNGASTVTASLPGWTLVDGPFGVNNQLNSSVYTLAVGSADSSSSHTVTITTGGAINIVGLVAQGTQDSISAHTSDSTLVASSAESGFTPGHADCLAVALTSAAHPSSTATGGAANSGWTRQVQPVTTPTTQTQVENDLDTKQLVGQNGTAQGSTTVTWNATVRTHKWMLVVAPATSSPPTAAFTATPFGRLVEVDGTASTAVGPATISSYDWDWGDGSSHGSGSQATHVYATSAVQNITLLVTDSAALTNSVSHSATTVDPTGTVSIIDLPGIPAAWTSASGTRINAVSDSNVATFINSGINPSSLELDFVLAPLLPPTSGQPLKVFLIVDAPASSSATLNAQLGEGSFGNFTQRSAITNQPIAFGTGTSVGGLITLTFPWTDVQNVSSGGWNKLTGKLQITAT